jgi:hypothetical protein
MSFVSVMKKIGQDIDKVFTSKPFQIGEQVAATVVSLAFPAMGPLFNITAQAVMTTAGNLIAQGLKDAGVSNVTETMVQQYISSVVTVLNATPAPASSTAVASS